MCNDKHKLPKNKSGERIKAILVGCIAAICVYAVMKYTGSFEELRKVPQMHWSAGAGLLFALSIGALCVISVVIWFFYREDYQKEKNHERKTLRIRCPQCNRLLRGATKEMIGEIAICPKCEAEFEIEHPAPPNEKVRK